MKVLFLSLAMFLSSSSLVASTASAAPLILRCSLTLMSPVPWAPAHMWIPPMTGVYDFSYKAGTEKKISVGVKNIVPGNPVPQYVLVLAKGADDTILTIDFSQIEPDGTKMKGSDFGYYFRRPNEGSNAAWAMGGYSKSASSEVDISKDEKGYIVMNCRW